jgi:hypothetical protein
VGDSWKTRASAQELGAGGLAWEEHTDPSSIRMDVGGGGQPLASGCRNERMTRPYTGRENPTEDTGLVSKARAGTEPHPIASSPG